MAKEQMPEIPKILRVAKNKNGTTMYVHKDVDNFLVWNYPDDYNYFLENKDLQEKVLYEVAEGKTLTGSARLNGIPISLILMMADFDKGFDKALKTAMRYRAETYHDRFANIADDVTEATSKSAKVKSDILRHLMTIGDRDRFGEQKKVEHSGGQTVTFVVDTGIRREAILAEGKTLVENKEDGRAQIDNDQDQHGVRPEADAVVDSLQAEAVQCPGVSPSVREDGPLHQRADRPVPEEYEAEPEVRLLRAVLQSGQEGGVGLPEAVHKEHPGDDV